MNLYYYSLKQKAFAPLFPRTTNAEELRAVNRYRTTSRGAFFVPVILFALKWGAVAAVTYFAGSVALDTAGEMALSLLLVLAEFFFWACGWFLTGMGVLLDAAIGNTISSTTYSTLSVITVGWTAVRDFSNMFFIFALLYIAIKTILGLGGGSTKKWVANLIIAAVLINFSLFATKVIVDAGNVLAMGFWNQMTITTTTETGSTTGPSVASHIMQGLKMQSIKDLRDSNGVAMKPTKMQLIFIHLGGGVTMLIAGYVFLAGAIMMIIRTVTLILLMIVSPFAFLGFGLPVGGGFAQKWLDKLIANAFVAPAFLAMLYLVVRIINSPDLQLIGGASDAKWGAMLAGDPGGFLIVYQFIMIITLLLASLSVANAVSAGAGSHAGAFAKKGLGYGAGAAFAGGAAGLRQTVGRAGKNKMNDKKWVEEQNRLVAKGNFMQRNIASAKLASAQGANKATFDARNSKFVSTSLALGGVNAGAGTTRSYKTTGQVGGALTGAYRGTENEKKLIETAKDRFDSPAAQKAYLERQGVELDAKRNKDIGKEINRGVKTEDVKKKVKDQPKEVRKAQQELDALKTRGADMKEIVAAEATLAQETKTLVDSIKQLSGKEFEETVSQKMLTENPEIMAAMGRTALMHVNANPDMYDSATREQIANATMTKGPEESRQYLISQQKLNSGHLPVDLGKQAKDRVKDYDVRKAELKKIQEKADTEEVRTAIQKLEEEHDSAIQDIIGGMKVKDVAKLDDAIKSHETMVQNYTPKHFDAIADYHKQIKGDSEDPKTKKMLSDIRVKAEGGTITGTNAAGVATTETYKGTTAGKAYMSKPAGKSFGGKSGPSAERKQAYADAQAATSAALEKHNAAQNNKFYVPGEKESAKKAYEDAQANEAKAKAQLNKKTGSAGDTDDEDGDDEAVV